jgi:hypothetical protein
MLNPFTFYFGILYTRVTVDYSLDECYQVRLNLQKSDKLSKLFDLSRLHGSIPTEEDFIVLVKSIPYFISTNNKTVILAAAMALNMWNDEVNNQHVTVEDEEMVNKLRGIYRILKTTPPF